MKRSLEFVHPFDKLIDASAKISYSAGVENQDKPHPPVEIPYQSLSEESLNGIIENYLQREGTDYGAVEISAETKSRQLVNQIRSGHTKIIFDPNSETVTLVTKEFWKKQILPLETL